MNTTLSALDLYDAALAAEVGALARGIVKAAFGGRSDTYDDEKVILTYCTRYGTTVSVVTGTATNYDETEYRTGPYVYRALTGFANEPHEFHPGKWIDYLRALLPRLERERDERVRREEEAARAELVARFTPVGAELDALFAEGGE